MSTRASIRTLTATLQGRASRSRIMFDNCSALKLIRESPPTTWRPAARRRVWRTFSVHCLLPISSDFMLFSRAR
jgi:hypothetical protein